MTPAKRCPFYAETILLAAVKLLWIYALLVGTSILSLAQNTQKQPTKVAAPPTSPSLRLDSLTHAINPFEALLQKGEWALAAAEGGRWTAHRGDAAADISKFIDKTAADRKRPGISESTLFLKHRDSITKLAASSLKPLFYGGDDGTPVRFVLKDGQIALLLGTMASENNNTLRLDLKQRSAQEIEATVLPQLREFPKFITSPDIKYFGVMVVYGSKDFRDKNTCSALHCEEFMAFVASAERCRKLSRAELTEEEFVDAADVYLVDEAVRKVKISLASDSR